MKNSLVKKVLVVHEMPTIDTETQLAGQTKVRDKDRGRLIQDLCSKITLSDQYKTFANNSSICSHNKYSCQMEIGGVYDADMNVSDCLDYQTTRRFFLVPQ